MISYFKMLAIMLAIAFAVLLSSVCSKPPENSKPKEATSSKAVEDMSGYTAIKQGEQMKKKLKEFEKTQEERSKDMEKTE